MEINSKMKKQIQHISLVLMLLLLGGMVNEAWAGYKVTYHILTLPLNHETGTANTVAEHDDRRIEAIKAIAVNAEKVKDLPDHFKSPLAMNFKYWGASDVTKSANAQQIYPNHSKTKHYLYTITGDTPLNEEDAITEDCDIYVTYEYNPDNGIAKLDGSESYNIAIGDGFLAYNKGRNNRLAVIPKSKLSGEQLASDQFVKVENLGDTKISTWWSGNLTPQSTAQSYFHLLFKYLCTKA